MESEAKKIEEALQVAEIYEKCKKGFYQMVKDSGSEFTEGRKKFEQDWELSLCVLKDLARSYLHACLS